jgi:large subunit ribosomal protein L31
MKTEIHPKYEQAHVTCMCGNEFTTRATRTEIHVEVCSNCHPFYTGRQKLMDTGGRVERFQRRVARGRLGKARTEAKAVVAQPEVAARAAGAPDGDTQSSTAPE